MGARLTAGACLILGIAVLLGACQGGSTGLALQPDVTSGDTRLTAPTTIQPSGADTGGFELQVLPDTFIADNSTAVFALAATPEESAGDRSNAVTVTISARKAIDLRALYCDLRYDPARYSPVSVEHLAWDNGLLSTGLPARGALDGDDLAGDADGDMLTLEVLSDPGVVHIGQVLANWDQRAGLSGDAELAQVRFAAEPFDIRRKASETLPVATERPLLTVIMQPAWLDWRWHQVGDYNQDGLVTASDLTPLGAHFGEVGDIERGPVANPDGTQSERFDFSGGDVRQLYDTSENGAIDIYDITAIGVNFSRGANSFAVYHSPGSAAYSADGPAAVEPLVVFPLSQVRRGDPSREMVAFNTALPSLTDGDYYWIQPLNSGAHGPASDFARVDLSIIEDFSVELRDECFIDSGHIDSARVEVGVSGNRVAVDLLISGYERMRFLSASLLYDPQLYRVTDQRETWGSICEQKSPVVPALSFELTYSLCRGLDESRIFATHEYESVAAGDEWRIARAFFTREPETFIPELLETDWMYWGTILNYDQVNQLLSWNYCLPGDGNQDSMVLLDDLLPIVRYLFQEVVDPNAGSGIADYNKDGRVWANDLTILGMHYGAHIEGYRVYMGNESSYENNSMGAQLLGSVSVLDDAIGDRFEERLRFAFHVDNPVSGQFLWIAPYIGSETYSPLGNKVEIP
jgi:hypothetical protein